MYDTYEYSCRYSQTIYRPVVLEFDEQDHEKFLRTKLQILGIEKYVQVANKLSSVMKIAGVLIRDANSYFHNGMLRVNVYSYM